MGGEGEMAIIDRSIRPRLGAGVGRLGGWEGDNESVLLLLVLTFWDLPTIML